MIKKYVQQNNSIYIMKPKHIYITNFTPELVVL